MRQILYRLFSIGMKVIERIEVFLNEYQISKNSFDTAIGAGNGYIGKQIKNNASIGSEMIQKIISIYNINPTWLLTGEGEILLTEQKAISSSDKKDIENKLLLELNECRKTIDVLRVENNDLKLKNMKLETELSQKTDISVTGKDVRSANG